MGRLALLREHQLLLRSISMAKRRREPDSDGPVAETAEFSTVFVNTSLDTHFAMLISSSDTVSDFRKKMALEHKQCFPTIGEIQVHSVKVERRSNFYHLPDIILLWSVFHGEVKGNWFLWADVSCAQKSHSIKNSSELNDNCRGLSPDINRIEALPVLLTDGATEKTRVSEMIDGIRFEKDSRPSKRRKVRKTEDACALFQASGKDVSKPDIVSCANLTAEVLVVRNDHFEETTTPNLGNTMTSQNLLASNETNLLEGKMSDELAPDDVTRLMDSGSKWKNKKKVSKITRKHTDMEQTETVKSCSETLKSDLNEDEENGLSLEKNDGVIAMPSNDHLDPVPILKESIFSRDADAVMEPENTSGVKKKKKKRQKKSVDTTNLENSGIDETRNCISLPLTDQETDKGEAITITHHDEKGVQVADSVILTQTESENGVSVKKKSTQSSSGNCHAVETETPVMELGKVDKGSENTGNKDRKASNKRKKQKQKQHTVAEVQVNLPDEDQQVGVDALSTKETLISVVNSEQEVRQVEEYSKTEEKSNGIADDLKTTSGINFKQYFVPDQDQHKEDSGDKVKKAIKSKMETSDEVHNSFKTPVNKKAENKSHRRKGGSAQNSDRDEVISKPVTTLQKPNESFHLNKKNQTSGLNVTNMIQMKTPLKKSLFTKSGAIFHDINGGESSGDENGADRNAFCPSDTSSMSGYDSSDLSQDSTRNGSNDAEGRPTRRTNISKLEISKDLTMDMILRSSKRFKKAKLIASQNDDEETEFVPESQPS